MQARFCLNTLLAHIHTRIRTRKRAHMYTHACTHTHTHAQMPPYSNGMAPYPASYSGSPQAAMLMQPQQFGSVPPQAYHQSPPTGTFFPIPSVCVHVCVCLFVPVQFLPFILCVRVFVCFDVHACACVQTASSQTVAPTLFSW
jgi:hypothetical protein